MFTPNLTVSIHSRSVDPDVFGQYTYEPAKPIRCSVITMDLSLVKSTVRADSSGSGGRAEEMAGVGKALFEKNANIKTGDVVLIDNQQLEIISIFVRHDVYGAIHHLEVLFRQGTLI